MSKARGGRGCLDNLVFLTLDKSVENNLFSLHMGMSRVILAPKGSKLRGSQGFLPSDHYAWQPTPAAHSLQAYEGREINFGLSNHLLGTFLILLLYKLIWH